MERKELGAAVKSSRQILVDSDAFVGWMNEKDIHHKKTSVIFKKIKDSRIRMLTNSWVVAETATVLSHRRGQTTARQYLQIIRDTGFPVIQVDEQLQQEATKIFEQQEKKGTSMVDCGNVATIKQNGLDFIFSFDKFYAKRFGIKSIDA